MEPNQTLAGTIDLDRTSPIPLYRQLYDGIRTAILEGHLSAGTRLPPTRDLAKTLELSRNTVVTAFEQLLAEGYLSSHVGRGTRVAFLPPEALMAVRSGEEGLDEPLDQTNPRPTLKTTLPRAQPAAFAPGLPDVAAFPHNVWARLLAKWARLLKPAAHDYDEGLGWPPLCEAIAEYLESVRGVRCSAEHVMILSSAQAGLHLAASLLADPGETAWVEDPGYQGARAAFRLARLRMAPLPVDGEGAHIDQSTERALTAPPKLIYVTPSHQFPLGATMTLPRRLTLLEAAERLGATVLEDDYDSEFRFEGRPLAALQGLDRHGRVIYVGTFSKTLFPGLRAAYLVLPPRLVERFSEAAYQAAYQPPTSVQAALAEFISSGQYGSHIRRMRTIYAERQAVLLDAAKAWPREARVMPASTGLQLALRLPERVDEEALHKALKEAGVASFPFSRTRMAVTGPKGLLLGFAGAEDAEIRAAAATMGPVLARFLA